MFYIIIYNRYTNVRVCKTTLLEDQTESNIFIFIYDLNNGLSLNSISSYFLEVNII